jgi:hypothetical protein
MNAKHATIIQTVLVASTKTPTWMKLADANAPMVFFLTIQIIFNV